MDVFKEWVSKRLCEINSDTDLGIFVPYVTSILEDEDKESLIEIIKEIADNNEVDLSFIANELTDKWNELNKSSNSLKEKISNEAVESLDAKMHNIIIQQGSDSAKQFSSNNYRTHIFNDKIHIVKMYGEISDEEIDGCSESNEVNESKDKSNSKSLFSSLSTPLDDLLTKNTNAQLIKDREKQAREQSKLDAEAKKLKDKEDKEKQRLKETDRKEAEKKRTQKGERRR